MFLFKKNHFETIILFYFLFLFLSGNLLSQGIFDETTGVFSFNYDPCDDKCSGLSIEDCRAHDLAVEQSKLCKEQCDRFTSDKDWLYCIHECNVSPPVGLRMPVRWGAAFVVTTNPQNSSRWNRFDIPWHDGSNPSFNFDTKVDWSGVDFYCYQYVVAIEYDDGTICRIGTDDWVCNS